MKKVNLLFLILMLLVSSLANAKIKIVATLPVFGSIAQAIGGEQVEVTNLSKPNQDPHYLEAKPSFALALSRADLLLQNGLELEIGWLPPLLTQSRNPKIQVGQVGNVNLSEGLQILEVPNGQIDRSMGDVHPLGNPHYWMDPRNGMIMARNISEKLSLIDPSKKEFYQSRLKEFETLFQKKKKEYEPVLTTLKNKKIISYHKSLSYFSNWSGLEIVSTIEPKPGIAPSSKDTEKLIALMSSEPIKGILTENFYPKKVSEYLSEKGSVPLLILPTQTGEEAMTSYFDLFDRIISELKKLK